MAECLLRDMANRAGAPLRVASAGTWATAGQPASPEVIELLREEGFELSAHRARTLTQTDIDAAELVLVMERCQKADILQRFARVKDKLHVLSAMSGQSGDVEDPHGKAHEDYVMCKQRIEELVRRGYPRIMRLALGQGRADGKNR
jgi:protein-tyrosine phosphatase